MKDKIKNTKSAQNMMLYISYHAGKFKTIQEIFDFKFACIGPSKDSPVAGGCAEIGQIVNLEFCMKAKCICDYSKSLERVYKKLKEKELKPEERREESISVAKGLVINEKSVGLIMDERIKGELDEITSEVPGEAPGEAPGEDSTVPKNETSLDSGERKEPSGRSEETEKKSRKSRKGKQKNEDGDSEEIQRLLFGE
uniref:Uncharacterized protein n=1 Tax=viral metagenome TaxID=1070528 RepID=A0A6H1ZY14_9ZZZZ